MFKYILSILLTLSLHANYYESGDEAYEDGDIKKAVGYWEEGSKNGEVESQLMLGFLYLRGDDVIQDQKKAATLLAKTFNSENSDETMLITVALTYYQNEKDTESIKLFEDAIDKAGKIAQYNLGMLLVEGNGIKKDVKKGNLFIKKSKQ